MPGRWWKFSRGWTASWQCNTKGVSSPPSKRPHDQGILRSFGTRTVHTAGPSRYTNGVIKRPEDEVESMGTVLEADRLRDDADRNGAARGSQDCDSGTQKAHPTTDGEMESGAEGETQGPVHPRDRPGSGHPRDTVESYMNAETTAPGDVT